MSDIKPAGYSGTHLAKKLGIVAGSRVVTMHAPSDYAHLLEPLPADVHFDAAVSGATDLIHVFAYRRSTLETELKGLRHAIRPDATVWASWPKKTAKVPTDITEDTVREVALPLGFVDVKVCAVSDIWSGLKLVIRKELR
ncbi:DUF3052 domain-containing protein [Variovorax sp. J22R133]|uniref:DUF3052 domain-containing protein n=1 Tax=Variovorax brevis TaxID=3053503 RepID=UPI002575D7CA|nr:DUF3052 domain-containing protein [Variovorax sp. J22R133]MDM0115102.1 DUF3052 domain-containing protein [Variovorax sp. J22R133]